MNELFNFKEMWSGELDNKKRVFIRWLTILVILLSVLTAIKTYSIFRYGSNNTLPPNTISVSGEGEVFAVPDIAEISFSAVSEEKTVKDAQDNVKAVMNETINFLKDNKIDEDDIKTVSYSAYPKYSYEVSGAMVYPPQPKKQVLVGYEVRHTILVKIRDTDKAGAILEGLGSRKVTDISGPNFSVDDDEALQAEARKMAIKDARDKAKKLARDLDVRLVRVVSFSEGGYGGIYYSKAMTGAPEADGRGGSIEIPEGENKISSNVTIVYEIR